MKLEFSFLSQSRSFIGFEIQRGGYMVMNKESEPVVKRTIDLSLGFLFGWMIVQIDFGGSFKVNDIVESMIEHIDKRETINKQK
jgi:hypothetical protein